MKLYLFTHHPQHIHIHPPMHTRRVTLSNILCDLLFSGSCQKSCFIKCKYRLYLLSTSSLLISAHLCPANLFRSPPPSIFPPLWHFTHHRCYNSAERTKINDQAPESHSSLFLAWWRRLNLWCIHHRGLDLSKWIALAAVESWRWIVVLVDLLQTTLLQSHICWPSQAQLVTTYWFRQSTIRMLSAEILK